MMCDFSVAPVRERGLKSHCRISPLLNLSRSREGAWIEIRGDEPINNASLRRSRERGRGLK